LDTVLEATLYGKEQGAFKAGSPQYIWLEETLKKAKDTNKEIFVFAHHPIFMPTNIYFSTSPDIRVDISVFPSTNGNLLPLLERYEITMYFAGHVHAYEHSVYKGIDVITTGATSFELWRMRGTVNVHRVKAAECYHYCKVRVSPPLILFSAVDEDGVVFDSWSRHFH